MQAHKRFSHRVIRQLRAEIADARGNEIFALGYLNEQGLVDTVEVLARGNEGSVLALRFEGGTEGEPRQADLLIHNHPSGFLSPSDNDLIIASRAAEGGIGACIVDNGVEEVYVIAEPVPRRARIQLDTDALCAALEEGGAVALRLPSYEPRESQIDLMRLIIKGFNEDALVAAEAGTGVGKSFAYLLPAMRYAQINDERIVISTATITLQQQLYRKDIPLVLSVLDAGGKKIKAVLIKGRGNYLCRRRLEDALREPFLDNEETGELRSLLAWAETTGTGDRQDLSFMPAEALWSRVCSEADACMGIRCPERERCFVFSLRKEAADARVLVVNHHLLFADLAARREGAGYDHTVVLPPYGRVIIDEAHTMEGAASSFFSKRMGRPGLLRQLGRLYRRRRGRQTGLLLRLDALVLGEGLDDAAEAVGKVHSAAEELDEAGLSCCGNGGVFRLSAAAGETIAALLFPPLGKLRKALASLGTLIRSMLEGIAEDNPVAWEIKSVLRRLDAAAAVCASFMEYGERNAEVMWIERCGKNPDSPSPGGWAEFTVTPIDVAPSLKEALFEPNRTVICVSATLTVAGSFNYWSSRTGIDLSARKERYTGCFPSPFPYHTSVLLAVPSGAPLPDQEEYGDFVNQAVIHLAETAGGSALILFTSYEALRSAHAAAAAVLEGQGIRCLKQGDDDRSRLLEAFLSDTSSVLFATDSFWEGIDAPGDTLRLVILCRLPFRSPNDPVFEARCEALEKRGSNAFMDLSLPESVMKFRQGFGRLIRRSSDRGVVAVLDGRLLRKQYGKFFLMSLPETRRSFSPFDTLLREVESFLYR
jgi:ATP-dependent DNA helicase DinG